MDLSKYKRRFESAFRGLIVLRTPAELPAPFIQPAFAPGGGRKTEQFQRLANKIKRAGDDDEILICRFFQRFGQIGAGTDFRRTNRRIAHDRADETPPKWNRR